jgi:cytochrome c peroxidase
MNTQLRLRNLLAVALLAGAACQNSEPAADPTTPPGTTPPGTTPPSTTPPSTTPPGTTPPSTTPPAAKGETVTSGSWTMTLPLGLKADRAYIPDDNPINTPKVELGRALYFDKRLSADNTIACASCHIPAKGGTDNAPTSEGIRGQHGGRSAPSMVNRLFSKAQFWDGRAPSLEAQAVGPIANPIEMGNTHDGAVATVAGIKGYGPMFEAAFGDPQVTIDRIGKALATYERVVVSGNSPYDKYQAGDKTAMTDAAIRGLAVFQGNDKGRCALCHRGFNFTGEDYKKLGVGMDAVMPDPGRYNVTKNEADRGAFKVPGLRNIALTAPYMHDGSVTTLEDVVNYYKTANHADKISDPDFKPLTLTAGEISDLVEFMKALTGDILNAEPPSSLPQ